jgi:septum formation protein
MPPPADQERIVRSAPGAGAYVEALAYLKASAVLDARGLTEGLVLGADTTVELDGEILGKPADEADARRILGRLAGTEHRVLTGLALVDVAACERRMAHDATIVHMRR